MTITVLLAQLVFVTGLTKGELAETYVETAESREYTGYCPYEGPAHADGFERDVMLCEQEACRSETPGEAFDSCMEGKGYHLARGYDTSAMEGKGY